MANPNFDALLSTTLKKYTPKLEDTIFTNLPLLFWLKEGDRIERVDGGEQLVEPLLIAQNSTAGSYAGYDNIDTTPQEGITAAQYDWKQYAGTIAIAGIEEAKNNGESKVISLLKSKTEQLELSIMETMNAMLFADGTGNGGKDWHGLALLVPTNPAVGTVGGINRATDLYWRSRVEATAEVLALSRISNLYNTCSKGKTKPRFGLTTQLLYEKYESLLQPQLRYQSSKTADAGFENLLYKSAPVMFDEDAAVGDWYFLNEKFLRLKVHKDVWFKNTPFEKPHGQDARYSQILCYGNLVTNNPRFLGKLANKTP